MPELALPYLVDALFDVGPAMPGAYGAVPLSYSELLAWQSSTGIVLAPWETRYMRILSREYVAAAHDASKHDCPAPWTDTDMVDKAHVAKKVRAILRD